MTIELTKKEKEMLASGGETERRDPIRELSTADLRAEVQRVRAFVEGARESGTGADDVASARVALRMVLAECRRRGVAP